MSLNTQYPVVDILGSTRTERLGRFSSKGLVAAITTDVENPWIFKKFMVSTAGDVSVKGTDGNSYIMPKCQIGIEYYALGIAINSSGTTATGIFVYGGV